MGIRSSSRTRASSPSSTTRVENNTFLGNGLNPDVLRAFASGDIVFVPDVVDPGSGMVLVPDPDPSDNCFADNAFDTDFPPGIVDLFPCP